ncbi:hypothetical protein G3I18_07120 [Actinospica acidiphila]|uniref:Uncharacterized protein n=1 Tax=Actinospica acidiphila TaxID=304899 RepID=A0A9X5HB43_9ACTN|nr:hypothetical protein [Actinospica acidiphila]NEC48348.1 hypothetical protein [Actinospica acidiphila]
MLRKEHMINLRTFVAAVGALGGIVLAGGGTGQAFAESEPAKCVEDSSGNVRCVQVSEYRLTDKDGKYQIVNRQSVACSSPGSSQIGCNVSRNVPMRQS